MAADGAPAAQKASGDALHSQGDYSDALKAYTAAADLCGLAHPLLPELHASIAETLFQLRRPSECTESCKKVLVADAGSVKARALLARVAAAGGRFSEAFAALQEAPSADPILDALRQELEGAQARLAEAEESLQQGNFAGALQLFKDLEEGLLFDSLGLLAGMGRCYLALGDVNRALRLSTAILRRDAADVAAHSLRAEAQFQGIAEHIDSDAWQKEAEVAVASARKALTLDPDNRSAARLRRRLKAHTELAQKVRAAVAKGDFIAAEEALSGAVDGSADCAFAAAGRFAARCYAERGRARYELERYEACIADCKVARRLDNRLTAASVVQAQALQKMEKWTEAVEVLEALHEWNKTEDIFWKKEWAIFEVRRVRRPPYYDILGLEPSATAAEIKKAYRRLSVENHPDKVKQRNPDLDANQVQEKFKLIGEAHEILGDPAKREFFDKGYDAQGIRECLQVRKRFAGQAPCSTCGEDESGKLGSDNKWYCLRCWDGYYRAKPEENPDIDDQAEASASKGPSPSTSATSVPQPARSTSGKVASWPDGCPLPERDAVAKMGVAELKGVLKTMQVDATGCLTKDDLRSCINDHLNKLEGQHMADADRAPCTTPVKTSADTRQTGTGGEAATPQGSADLSSLSGSGQLNCTPRIPAVTSCKGAGDGHVSDVDDHSQVGSACESSSKLGSIPTVDGLDWSFSFASDSGDTNKSSTYRATGLFRNDSPSVLGSGLAAAPPESPAHPKKLQGNSPLETYELLRDAPTFFEQVD